jgi:hypothetical protein
MYLKNRNIRKACEGVGARDYRGVDVVQPRHKKVVYLELRAQLPNVIQRLYLRLSLFRIIVATILLTIAYLVSPQ